LNSEASSHQAVDIAPEVLVQLRECKRPMMRQALPGAPLRVRVETSPALRRALPGRLVLAAEAKRAERAWESSPALRESALLGMEAIVAGTHREPEVPELARRGVIDAAVRESLLWQPWPRPVLDAESSEHLRRAAHSGRGMIASNCHIGPFNMGISIYRDEVQRTPHILGGPWMFEPPKPGLWGRRTARWWEGARRGGARMVKTSGGAFATAVALLQAGEVVIITYDMPGSRTTQFLGKPVDMASGTARMAYTTDSLVIPVRIFRKHARTYAEYAPALDARDFDSADDMHDALAAIHGRWILDEPEALQDPRRPGAWEQGAGRERWARPPRGSAGGGGAGEG
jgi:hypothetical protein